jgi:hypothetical protein
MFDITSYGSNAVQSDYSNITESAEAPTQSAALFV